MTMMLKVLSGAETPDTDRQEHSIFADVVSCHFHRYPEEDGCFGWAHLWLREPVKTGMVPGYCEVEKRVTLDGPAFLMNENGRTISSFRP